MSLDRPLGMNSDMSKFDKSVVEKLDQEKKRSSGIELMKMKLKPDLDGQFFFNQILYAFYKNLFAKQGIFEINELKGLGREFINDI